MVVFPAASKPTIKILISFFPHNLSNSLENVRPIFAVCASRLYYDEALVRKYLFTVVRISEGSCRNNRVNNDRWSRPWLKQAIS